MTRTYIINLRYEKVWGIIFGLETWELYWNFQHTYCMFSNTKNIDYFIMFILTTEKRKKFKTYACWLTKIIFGHKLVFVKDLNVPETYSLISKVLSKWCYKKILYYRSVVRNILTLNMFYGLNKLKIIISI